MFRRPGDYRRISRLYEHSGMQNSYLSFNNFAAQFMHPNQNRYSPLDFWYHM